MTRIPLTVVGGFLGAGKTTLLQHWLSRTARRIAVLVNDFGALNIDAALIRARGADTLALSNGCVCCMIGDDLSQALQRVLAQQPGFDAIVVEASGVSDPWRIAQYGLADPQLTLSAVLVLVDAEQVAAQAADPLLADTLQRQLRRADLLLLNKVDLASPAVRQAARALLRRCAPPVAVPETVQAKVPLALLESAALHVARGGDLHCQPGRHAQQFDTWSAPLQKRVSMPALRAWAQGLPADVLRLKALVHDEEGRPQALHRVGQRVSSQPLEEDAAFTPGIVAIGLAGRLRLPEADFESSLFEVPA